MTKVYVLEDSTTIYDSDDDFIKDLIESDYETLEIIHDNKFKLLGFGNNSHLIEESLENSLQYILNKLPNIDPNSRGDGRIYPIILSLQSEQKINTSKSLIDQKRY